MAFKFRKHRKIAEVHQFDGPTSAGGASMNVYVYENDECETVEYDWLGREVARYAGEPRDVPPGVGMPPAPPRPPGAAPPLPMIGLPPARVTSPPAPIVQQAPPPSPAPARSRS